MDYYKHTKRMFNVGDIVIVKPDSDLSKTHMRFTATDEMHRLHERGTHMTVSRVADSDNCRAGYVSAKGFSWHPADLVVVEHVNDGPLVTDGPEGVFQFDPQTI